MGLVACEAAYKYGRQWLNELKEYLLDNLNFLRDYLETNIPQIKLIESEGTYLIWLDCSALGFEDKNLKSLSLKKPNCGLTQDISLEKKEKASRESILHVQEKH